MCIIYVYIIVPRQCPKHIRTCLKEGGKRGGERKGGQATTASTESGEGMGEKGPGIGREFTIYPTSFFH